jgi:hypothetical protein
MSLADVEALASKSHIVLRPAGGKGKDATFRGSTGFQDLELRFSNHSLYGVRRRVTISPSLVREYPMENLCTGETTVRVTISNRTATWAGAEVIVDGIAVASLPRNEWPVLDLELSGGVHSVKVRSQGAATDSFRLSVSEQMRARILVEVE